MGPVDVIIIGFPGNKFNGRIAPAILELVEAGTIEILDLLFVMKDADGVVTALEFHELNEQLGTAVAGITVSAPGALDLDDAEEIREDLPLNSSALAVAFENTWAAKFVDAIRDADAVVIDQIRIPAAAAEIVLGR
jgi:uncharacterized membrane protein